MKKTFIKILTVIVLVSLFSINAFASATDDYKSIYNKINNETQELLRNAGVNDIDFDDLISISPKKVFGIFLDIFKGAYKKPFEVFVILLGYFILSSVFKSMCSSSVANENYFCLFETAVVISVLIKPLSEALTLSLSSLKLISSFMLAYIPIYTGLISASGQPVSSFTYSSSLLVFSELCVKLTETLIMPIITIILCLNIYSSLNSSFNLTRLTGVIRKLITVFLSVASTIFIGLVGIKGNLAITADSLALKGAKTVSGAVIPIIGGAIGDSLNSVLGSIALIKGTFGVFGIIAVILMILPSIIQLLIWYFVMDFLSAVSETVGNTSSNKIFDSIRTTVSLVNIFNIFVSLVFIITTGIMLSLRS